jgi:hypothetical protein
MAKLHKGFACSPLRAFLGTIAYPGLPGLQNLSVGDRSCKWVLEPIPLSQAQTLSPPSNVCRFDSPASQACYRIQVNGTTCTERRHQFPTAVLLPQALVQSVYLSLEPLTLACPRATLRHKSYPILPLQSADVARHLPALPDQHRTG